MDNQLPVALAVWLRRCGYDAAHVLERDLSQADDRSLWEAAVLEARIMISEDEDFFILATRPADKGRLLWVRVGNCRTHALILALEKAWANIEAAFASGQTVVEIR